MRKNLYPILIFGAFFMLLAQPGRAADEPKNPARPQAETSGIPFDINQSTMSNSPVKDLEIPPAAAAGTDSMPAPVVESGSPELQKARTLLNSGDWRGARRASLAYLDSHAKSSEAWTLLAGTYAADKKFKKAVRRFDKALKFNPHNAEAFYGKGQAFEAQGKLDEASNEYQAAMRADSKMPDARAAWQRIKDQVSSAP